MHHDLIHIADDQGAVIGHREIGQLPDGKFVDHGENPGIFERACMMEAGLIPALAAKQAAAIRLPARNRAQPLEKCGSAMRRFRSSGAQSGKSHKASQKLIVCCEKAKQFHGNNGTIFARRLCGFKQFFLLRLTSAEARGQIVNAVGYAPRPKRPIDKGETSFFLGAGTANAGAEME